MKEDRDDFARPPYQPLPGFDSSPAAGDNDDEPQASAFDLDPDDGYEEPERDTDYALGFYEETVDEEEALDNFLPEELEGEGDSLFEEQETFLMNEVGTAGGAQGVRSVEQDWETEKPPQPATDWDAEEPEAPAWQTGAAAAAVASPQWNEEETHFEEEVEEEGLPLGLIAVGVLALLLVIAGAYGIMQQRSATAEQIRQLEASLATSTTPEEVTVTRAALQNAKEQIALLNARIDNLTRDNRSLSDTISGLESQLAAEQAALKTANARAAAAARPAAVAPASPKPSAPSASEKPSAAPATPKPTAPAAAAAPAASSATTVQGGDWFVNFGSYGSESTARNWADRLKPEAGVVIVSPTSKDDRTFYRVRIVDLGSRQSAEAVAGQLQTTYGLPKLWVGQQ